MAYGQHGTISPDHCIGIELGLKALEVIGTKGATELIPSVVVEEKNFSTTMIVNLFPVAQQAVKNRNGNSTLLAYSTPNWTLIPDETGQ